MNFDSLFEHIVVSILGWLLGGLFGIGGSLILIKVWQKFHRANKKVPFLTLFLPWRAVFAGLILLNYFPLLLMRWLVGMGTDLGILSVAYTVFFLTLIIAFQAIQHRSAQPLVQITSWMRTLAVFSLILTFHFGLSGGGGIGFIVFEQLGRLDYEIAWLYFWALCMIALIIDVGLAFVEWLIHSYASDKLHRTTENAA